MTELKPCPFCGKTEHLEIVKREDSKHPKHYFATCDITSGGCGGIGGYRFSKQEAIEAWNQRYELTCIKIHKKIPGVPSTVPYCSECNVPLSGGAKFCHLCGKRVIEE